MSTDFVESILKSLVSSSIDHKASSSHPVSEASELRSQHIFRINEFIKNLNSDNKNLQIALKCIDEYLSNQSQKSLQESILLDTITAEVDSALLFQIFKNAPLEQFDFITEKYLPRFFYECSEEEFGVLLQCAIRKERKITDDDCEKKLQYLIDFQLIIKGDEMIKRVAKTIRTYLSSEQFYKKKFMSFEHNKDDINYYVCSLENMAENYRHTVPLISKSLFSVVNSFDVSISREYKSKINNKNDNVEKKANGQITMPIPNVSIVQTQSMLPPPPKNSSTLNKNQPLKPKATKYHPYDTNNFFSIENQDKKPIITSSSEGPLPTQGTSKKIKTSKSAFRSF